MPRLLVIDDRDQTVDMVQRQLPEFDTVTRCDRNIPCQVCEERERGCPLRCAHDYGEAAQALSRLDTLPDLVVLDLHFALLFRIRPQCTRDMDSHRANMAASTE